MSRQANRSSEPRDESSAERRSVDVSPERDPLGALEHEVLALFRGPLREVRFPDLELATLEAAVKDVLRAQVEVESLEAALDAARARVRATSTTLTTSAERAVAYARVFATGQPAIEAALAGLLEARGGVADERGAAPKRRSRRKPELTGELLPIEGREATADGTAGVNAAA